MEYVIPLAAEEALSSIPENQSPTLMMEGVLNNLALDREIVAIPEVEEEERSSSMPGKDENEGGDADDEDQTKNSPKEHTKQQVIIQAEKTSAYS